MKKTNINAIIDIPKGSNIKYEFDRKTGKVIVDRILYGANVYPYNYGYIENTLDWDGDELDVLIISDHSFAPGCQVPINILGAMKMIDDGETDTKLIGVISCDPRWSDVKALKDLNQHRLLEIEDFFSNYKNLQNKTVKINGFENEDWANKELIECENLYKKYHNIPKSKFLELMKASHPEKYTV